MVFPVAHEDAVDASRRFHLVVHYPAFRAHLLHDLFREGIVDGLVGVDDDFQAVGFVFQVALRAEAQHVFVIADEALRCAHPVVRLAGGRVHGVRHGRLVGCVVVVGHQAPGHVVREVPSGHLFRGSQAVAVIEHHVVQPVVEILAQHEGVGGADGAFVGPFVADVDFRVGGESGDVGQRTGVYTHGVGSAEVEVLRRGGVDGHAVAFGQHLQLAYGCVLTVLEEGGAGRVRQDYLGVELCDHGMGGGVDLHQAAALCGRGGRHLYGRVGASGVVQYDFGGEAFLVAFHAERAGGEGQGVVLPVIERGAAELDDDIPFVFGHADGEAVAHGGPVLCQDGSVAGGQELHVAVEGEGYARARESVERGPVGGAGGVVGQQVDARRGFLHGLGHVEDVAVSLGGEGGYGASVHGKRDGRAGVFKAAVVVEVHAVALLEQVVEGEPIVAAAYQEAAELRVVRRAAHQAAVVVDADGLYVVAFRLVVEGELAGGHVVAVGGVVLRPVLHDIGRPAEPFGVGAEVGLVDEAYALYLRREGLAVGVVVEADGLPGLVLAVIDEHHGVSHGRERGAAHDVAAVGADAGEAHLILVLAAEREGGQVRRLHDGHGVEVPQHGGLVLRAGADVTAAYGETLVGGHGAGQAVAPSGGGGELAPSRSLGVGGRIVLEAAHHHGAVVAHVRGVISAGDACLVSFGVVGQQGVFSRGGVDDFPVAVFSVILVVGHGPLPVVGHA